VHQSLRPEPARHLPQKRQVRPRLSRFRILAFASLLMGACRRDESQVSFADVKRCERGIEGAMAQSDVTDAMRAYYRECAGVYAQPACKRAFVNAASSKVSEQMSNVVTECRAAYCPLFRTRALEICQSTWRLTRVNIRRSWPALHDAILTHDAGVYAPRVRQAMLVFYARIAERTGTLTQTQGGASGARSAAVSKAPISGSPATFAAPGAAAPGASVSAPAAVPQPARALR
jgi:hypothetical protein